MGYLNYYFNIISINYKLMSYLDPYNIPFYIMNNCILNLDYFLICMKFLNFDFCNYDILKGIFNSLYYINYIIINTNFEINFIFAYLLIIIKYNLCKYKQKTIPIS